MYSSIITKLKSEITGIANVQAIFDYEPTSFTKYPSVTITPVGHTEEYETLRDTKRTVTFSIKVYGSLTGTNDTTQVTVRDIVDAIIDKLGQDVTLDGTITYSLLTDGAFRSVVREQAEYVGEITYKAITLFNRYA